MRIQRKSTETLRRILFPSEPVSPPPPVKDPETIHALAAMIHRLRDALQLTATQKLFLDYHTCMVARKSPEECKKSYYEMLELCNQAEHLVSQSLEP